MGGMGGTLGKPPFMTDVAWQDALSSAPSPPVPGDDTMTPHPLKGWADLKERVKSQSSLIDHIQAKVRQLSDRIERMRTEFRNDLQPVLEGETGIISQGYQISQLLLKELTGTEVPRLDKQPFTSEEHDAYDRIRKRRDRLTQPIGPKWSLAALKSKAELIQACGNRSHRAQGTGKLVDGDEEANRAAIEDIAIVLDGTNLAITKLTHDLGHIKKVAEAYEKKVKEYRSGKAGGEGERPGVEKRTT
jgi:hypothetical protein